MWVSDWERGDETMKFRIKDGSLCMDLGEFVDEMDKPTRDELCKHLIADDALFTAVADYVSTGEFNEGWWHSPNDLAELRARFAPLMPDVARELVRQLVFQRDAAKMNEERHSTAYWKLWHAWQERGGSYPPEFLPKHEMPTHIDEEHAAEALRTGVVP